MAVTRTHAHLVARTKHRILIVDDDPDLIEVSSIVLGLDGHDCQTASSGSEALAIAREFEPDIAIVDLGLRGMSGHDVAIALRAAAGGRALHLAAMTGRSGAVDLARARAAGFDQYVVKPVAVATLRHIVLAAEHRARAGSVKP